MKFKKVILFFLISLFTQITLAKKGDHGPWKWNKDLPGTIQIDTNFYVDQFETTNFNWLEYMYWVKRVFGAESPKYISTIPHSKLWVNANTCLNNMGEFEHYLRHPSYQNYPLVGITQQQVEEYCKWRSDRVFEYMLILKKQLKSQPNQDSSNYFSIDNYFNGKYNDSPPNWEYNVYPEYSLPTLEQWQKMINYTHVQNEKIKNQKKKYTLNNWINIQPCVADTLIDPTAPVDRWAQKTHITHLTGNVSEWLKEANQFIGPSWQDSTTQESNLPRTHNGASISIGFRSICTWKEFQKP